MQSLTKDELSNKSQAFRDFYSSFLDFDPHDGPQIDSSALLALVTEERSLAESLLIERIESAGGGVIQALADMKSERGAVVLKKLAETAGGTSAAEIALALWQIERWPQAETMLIDVLEGRRKYFPDSDLKDFEATGRADAAWALGEILSPRAKTALRHALNDPDSMVRHWARVSLGVEEGESAGHTPARKWWQFWKA